TGIFTRKGKKIRIQILYLCTLLLYQEDFENSDCHQKRDKDIFFMQKREKKIYLRDSFSLNVPEIKQPASFHICLVAVPDKFCPKPEAKVREL
ncbi:hypothetical protein, partial [Bacteroides fragilis]